MSSLLILVLIGGLIFSSCAKKPTPEEIEFEKCSKEALTVVPSSVTLEFESNPFSDETTYILKKIRWKDDETSLTNRGFKKKTTSQENKYFPLQNKNQVQNSWFYTEPIYYDRPKKGISNGLQAEYEFILIPTEAIFYEKKYNDLTNVISDDKNRGRRVFDIDDAIVEKCKLVY